MNRISNGQSAEIGREDGLIDVVILDFSTEGWIELEDEE